MLIARNAGQLGTENMAQESLRLQFDFVVTENSIYTPGSGPEVPEPTPMADHDRDGFIISEINNFKGKFTYIVTWKDKPHLLVSVRPQKIRDYVSARSYEEWNTKQMVTGFGRLDTANTMSSEGTGPKLKGKPGKKRKRKKASKQPVINQNPQIIQKIPNSNHKEALKPLSNQQTPLAPTKTQDLNTIKLNDTTGRIRSISELKVNGADESSFRDSHHNMNIVQAQSNVNNELPKPRRDSRPKRLATKSPIHIVQNYQSLSESSSDINPAQKLQNPMLGKLRTTRPSTRSFTPHSHKNINALNMNSIKSKCRRSPGVSSPIEASADCNALQKDGKNTSAQHQTRKIQNLVEDYFKPQRSPIKNHSNSEATALQPENEPELEVEYQVEDIKDEKWEQDKKGNGVLFYLIKLKGSQIYTWEPEENIGSDVLAEYTANKIARVNRTRRRSSIFNINSTNTQENDNELDSHFGNGGMDSMTKTRKAKQKAMAINMFEPEIPNKKRGGIPGDLGDEDELFQVAPIRRRRSGTRR